MFHLQSKLPDGESKTGTVQKAMPRYISLQQAQEMGLVPCGKINPVLIICFMFYYIYNTALNAFLLYLCLHTVLVGCISYQTESQSVSDYEADYNSTHHSKYQISH